MADEAVVEGMKTLSSHIDAVQGVVEDLLCQVRALREMVDPAREQEFQTRLTAARQRAKKAQDFAEIEERLRQIVDIVMKDGPEPS